LRKILGLILLLPFAAAAQEPSLGPGRVLIADKDLHDPHFEQTVIILLSYDEEAGAGGLILNRPSEVLVSQALKEIPEARGNRALAYEGGPVQTRKVLALLRTADKLDEANEVVPGIYTVGTTRLLKKALTEKNGHSRLRRVCRLGAGAIGSGGRRGGLARRSRNSCAGFRRRSRVHVAPPDPQTG